MNKISEISHSEIGSTHWFNTLLAHILHTGEYLRDHGSQGIDEGVLKRWGITLVEDSRELLDWFKDEKIGNKQHLIEILEQSLKALKEE